MDTQERKQWFALNVRSRHEKCVLAQLEAKQKEVFLPLYNARRKWADRIATLSLPLFPGYLFCRFDPAERSAVIATSGLLDVVRIGRDMAPIEAVEIEAIRRVTQSTLLTEPYSGLVPGQTVTMSDGPLSGLTGKLMEIRGGLRLVLSVELLQRSVLVEIDKDWVIPHPLITSCMFRRGDAPIALAAHV
jgi:transcription antitermination factor NusG